MEGFRCGLDEDIRFVIPQGDPCWTLEKYINFTLWVNGPAFTMGEVEDNISLIQPHLTDVLLPSPKPSPSPP